MTLPAPQPTLIGFGKAVVLTIPHEDIARALSFSWRSGREVLGWGKHWVSEGSLVEVDGVMFGRLAARSDRPARDSLRYNTRLYGRVEPPQVTTIPFAIRISDGTLAYQVNWRLGRYDIFPAGLELALNSGDFSRFWAIESLVRTVSFDAWRTDHPNVTDFDITVRRPNPHYFGANEVEKAIEEVRAEVVRLVAHARTDESLDASADLFRQAVDHVTRGYGHARVRALDPAGTSESEWLVVEGGPVGESPVRRLLTGRVKDDVVSDETLFRALEDPPDGEFVRILQYDDE